MQSCECFTDRELLLSRRLQALPKGLGRFAARSESRDPGYTYLASRKTYVLVGGKGFQALNELNLQDVVFC